MCVSAGGVPRRGSEGANHKERPKQDHGERHRNRTAQNGDFVRRFSAVSSTQGELHKMSSFCVGSTIPPKDGPSSPPGIRGAGAGIFPQRRTEQSARYEGAGAGGVTSSLLSLAFAKGYHKRYLLSINAKNTAERCFYCLLTTSICACDSKPLRQVVSRSPSLIDGVHNPNHL